MATGDSKIVDEATTTNMIKSFSETQDDCDRIQKLVDGAHTALMAQWGGNAAGAYDNSMVQWKEGFTKVRSALNMLNESMVQYAQITSTTEDDNVVQGTGWATVS